MKHSLETSKEINLQKKVLSGIIDVLHLCLMLNVIRKLEDRNGLRINQTIRQKTSTIVFQNLPKHSKFIKSIIQNSQHKLL